MARSRRRRFPFMPDWKRASCSVGCSEASRSGCRTQGRCRRIGRRCHELRINDEDKTWRIVYRIDEDAIVIADVFAKKTQSTPKRALENAKARLRKYDDTVE